MSGLFPESRVVEIWRDCLAGRTDLVTENDGPVEVVYPGRPNDDRGADLRDAVIANSGGIQKGDVEIHVRSSSWWGHGHHQDPLYNRVILHVVYQHDTEKAVVRQDGRRVPTLALGKFITDTRRRPMPCRSLTGRRGEAFIGGVLDAAGDWRFQSRVSEFKQQLDKAEPGQILYQGIMGALGYIKNKAPMLELASRLPLSRLAAAAAAGTPPVECLAVYQALLLGAAGLLPSQVGWYPADAIRHSWIGRLEKTWESFGEREAMPAGDWHSFKVRPGNLPRRRLAAMSYLLLRYREEGLLAGLTGVFDGDTDALEDSLLVRALDYWAENLDFGLPCRRHVPALLGMDRAQISVINVLLPFAAARGQEKAQEIYRLYPALAANALERHMARQLGVSRFLVDSARRQQGLLHLYKTSCSQGKCGECPLG